MTNLRLFIRLSRPLFLFGAALLYALGAGIARYLGTPIDWGVYALGQVWVTTLQLSTHYLNEYFDYPADSQNPNRTLFTGGSGALGPDKLPRVVALIAAITTLTLMASFTVLLIQNTQVSLLLTVILAVSFLGAFFYSVPPVQLASTGYGELTTSILVANLLPTFAFVLQYGNLHRLLAMTTFPLTALHLAMLLAFELPDYAADQKSGKRTLLVRMGWQAGMSLHNILVLTTFLLFAVAMVFGLPLAIGLPCFLPLPLAAFQIWQMRRIAGGAKPGWTALTLTATALLGSVVYLLAFAFWTR